MIDDTARRAYWAEQMDAAYAFMQRMRDYPVSECGEPLIYLPSAVAEVGVTVTFSTAASSNGKPRLYFLRAGLLPSFLAVAREMNARGWLLKVEDAFRTIEMQQYNARWPMLYHTILHKVMWECGGEAPTLDLFTRRMAALIAPSPKVGTHLSGSAMDISVLDRDTGEEIDRGRPYLEMSEITPMESPFVSAAARYHRREITELFARHGFVAYPWEFWHYSAGDAYAADLCHTGQPACYGPVHLDMADGSVTPIADPGRLLNNPDDFAAIMQQVLAESGVPD